MDEKLAVLQEMQERGHARELGHLENYFAICQRQDLYTNFSMFCELSDACSFEEFTFALRSICLENPILLHTVIPKKWPNHLEYYASEEYTSNPVSNHEFMRLLENVNMSDLLMNTQDEYAEVVSKIFEIFNRNGGHYTSEIFDMTAAIRIPYGDPVKPNWRVLCFPGGSENSWSKFLYISNHCSSDAGSAMNLFKDISAQLNNLPEKLPTTDTVFDYSSDYEKIGRLPIPIEQRVDYKPPLTYFPQLLGAQFLRNHLSYHSKGAVVSRITTPDEGNRAYSRFLNFTSEQMQAIKNKIKTQVNPQCTMTPFLQTCLLVSLYKSGKIFSGSFREWFMDMVIPMRTSQLLPDDDEVRDMYKYGANIGGSRYNYLISSLNIGDDKEAFWSLVKYYNDVFIKAKENKHYLYPLGALMLDSVRQRTNVDKIVVDDLLGLPRDGAVLSNIGFVKQAADIKKYKIQDMVFSQTLGSLRHSFTMSACTTAVGGMNIVACAAHGTVSCKKDWEDLCELFKQEVLTI